MAAALLASIAAALSVRADMTLAAFSAATSSPGNSFVMLEVQPATLTAVSSLEGGVVRLTWSASATGSTETVTYAVLRRPSGTGAFAQVATLSGLTHDDLPPADGVYDYAVRTIVATFSRDSEGRAAISDRTPPTVTVTCDGAVCGGWYASAVGVLTTASDAGTGVQTVRTTLDGVTRTTDATSVTTTVSGEGAHSFSAMATDNVNNPSATQTYSFGIDATTPTAATGLAAAGGRTGGTVDLTWTAATDATSGVAGYAIRYVQAASCPPASPSGYPSALGVGAVTAATVSGLRPGRDHCFYLITSDTAGNESAPSNVASAKAK